MLDAAPICTEFCGVVSTQFCFTYLLGGISPMPRGLHALLCHDFLVVSKLQHQTQKFTADSYRNTQRCREHVYVINSFFTNSEPFVKECRTAGKHDNGQRADFD